MSDVHEVGKRGGRAGRIGTILRDKWRVDARLGTGGMAAVYSATHHRNGNRVALKILHMELSRDEETRKRFLREGYVANAVNHPGTVRVLDDDVTEDGCAFLVLELLEGESAEARRERIGGRLPLTEVLHIGDRLLDVLASAHEQKIIHRDVKPENIFLTNNGNVKLLDFGIARMRDGLSEATKTGVMLGTPDFMSPEQASGRSELDGRTDVYLTGATIFTLLSGQRVHMGETIRDQLFAITTMRARSLATVAPGVPAAIVQVIDKSLELEMSDRWPNARAMQIALRAAAGMQQETDLESVTIQVSSPFASEQVISTPPTPVMTPRRDTPPSVLAAARPDASDRLSPSSDDPTVMGAPRFTSTPLPQSAPVPPGPRPLAPPGAHAGPIPATPQMFRPPMPSPYPISSSHGPQGMPMQHGGFVPQGDGTGSGQHRFPPAHPPAQSSGIGRVLLVLLLVFIGVCIAMAVYLARGGRVSFATGAAPSVTLSANPPIAPPSSSAR
jgi:serine/threonine-protein kinase